MNKKIIAPLLSFLVSISICTTFLFYGIKFAIEYSIILFIFLTILFYAVFYKLYE